MAEHGRTTLKAHSVVTVHMYVRTFILIFALHNHVPHYNTYAKREDSKNNMLL